MGKRGRRGTDLSTGSAGPVPRPHHHRRGGAGSTAHARTLARCWTPHRCWPCSRPSSRPVTADASASATRCWHGWCAAGRVQPVRRGLFRLPTRRAADRHAAPRSRIRAVAAAFADDHAVSHLSAAALLGLPMPLGPPGPVHLTRLSACHRSRRAPDGVVIDRRRLQRDAGRRAPRRTGDGGRADGCRLRAHVAADCLGPRRRRGAPPRVGHRAAGRGPPRGAAPLDRCAAGPPGAGDDRRPAARPGSSRTRSSAWTGWASPAGAPR